jgi:hypothetical protein
MFLCIQCLEERGDKECVARLCVTNDGTGECDGCHETRRGIECEHADAEVTAE